MEQSRRVATDAIARARAAESAAAEHQAGLTQVGGAALSSVVCVPVCLWVWCAYCLVCKAYCI